MAEPPNPTRLPEAPSETPPQAQYLARFKNPLMLILLVASAVSAFTEEATHFLIVRVIRALKARGRGGRDCCLAFYGDRHLLWIRAATGFLLCRPGGHGAGLPLHGGIGQTGVLSMGEQWSPWTGEILIQTLHHDLAKALAKPATNLVWPSRLGGAPIQRPSW